MCGTQYAPVGYAYNAANYCLDCIADVMTPERFRELYNCAECALDAAAARKGIRDRYDERSYDSGDFPKSIPYHNDLHSECGPEGYGYGPEDPEYLEQYCNATCTVCGEVIDGESQLYAPDKCPAYVTRAERIEEMRA